MEPGTNKKNNGYTMTGHTLPGINQRSDATAANVAEQGLAGSSVFQKGIGDYKGEGSYSKKPPAPKFLSGLGNFLKNPMATIAPKSKILNPDNWGMGNITGSGGAGGMI